MSVIHVTVDYALAQIYDRYRKKYGKDPNFQIACVVANKYECMDVPVNEIDTVIDRMLREVESLEQKMAVSPPPTETPTPVESEASVDTQTVSGHVVLTPTQDGWIGGFTVEADKIIDARIDLVYETYQITVHNLVYYSGFSISIGRVDDGKIVETVYANSYMKSGRDSRTILLKPKATYMIALRGYANVDAMKSAFDKLATVDFKITITGVNVKVGETTVSVTDAGVTLSGGSTSSQSVSLSGTQTSGAATGTAWDAFAAVGTILQYLPYIIILFLIVKFLELFRR